ncbi:MAG: hypothetical protein WCD04_15985 [Terriglobia bacterium]
MLVNFDVRDAAVLGGMGFNLELGKVGGPLRRAPGTSFVAASLPHPTFDYDVYVFNSALWDSHNPQDAMWTNSPTLNTLAKFGKPPNVRISFIGGGTEYDPVFLGVPGVGVEAADKGVSSFYVLPANTPAAIPPLHEAIGKLVGVFKQPVGQYIRGSAADASYDHIPVVTNRNYDVVAAYGVEVREGGGKPSPVYVILPQLEDNARALLELLELFVELTPEVFPDLQRRVWFDSEEFAFREEKEIVLEIEGRRAELNRFVEEKEAERKLAKDKFDFIKRILIATESDIDPVLRLSGNVKKVLEFLDFKVEDIDAKMKSAIKKEDFWTRDGDFLAITEVSGTKNKNPKTKEYSDLLGRMTTVYKRRDLVPDSKSVTGLLILNYDIETHPFRRPRLYSGGDEEYVSAAKDRDIGLLSTVELYKIAVAAKDGVISKEKARELIKEFGRIELLPE